MSSIALAQQLLAKEELHREQLSIEFVMSKADVAEVESVLFGVLQSVEMCRLIMWRCGAAEDETDAISSFESHVSSHVRKVIIAKMKKIGSLKAARARADGIHAYKTTLSKQSTRLDALLEQKRMRSS